MVLLHNFIELYKSILNPFDVSVYVNLCRSKEYDCPTMKITLVFLFHLLQHLVVSEGNGYSFYKFFGPVSGQVYPVSVHNPHLHKQTVDYVAKPDYAYSYGVEDPHTGNSQARQESRDGDAVKGEYTVLQSDGIVRTVRYTADPKNGFQASVHYSPHPERS